MLILGELLLDRDDNDAAMRMFVKACVASARQDSADFLTFVD